MTQGPSDRYNFADSYIKPFLTQYFLNILPNVRSLSAARHFIYFFLRTPRSSGIIQYLLRFSRLYIFFNKPCLFFLIVVNKILKLEHESLLTGELTVHVIYGNNPGKYCLRNGN